MTSLNNLRPPQSGPAFQKLPLGGFAGTWRRENKGPATVLPLVLAAMLITSTSANAVSFRASEVKVEEGRKLVFNIDIRSPDFKKYKSYKIYYKVVGGTARAGDDFYDDLSALKPHNFTSSKSKEAEVRTRSDSRREGDETLSLHVYDSEKKLLFKTRGVIDDEDDNRQTASRSLTPNPHLLQGGGSCNNRFAEWSYRKEINPDIDPKYADDQVTHAAVDIFGKMNEEVYSFGEGQVVATGNEIGIGRYIIVRHPGNLYPQVANGSDFFALYGHLITKASDWTGRELQKSDWVGAGGKVGNVGGSGSYGNYPHLHFELRTFAGLWPDVPLWTLPPTYKTNIYLRGEVSEDELEAEGYINPEPYLRFKNGSC